MPNLQNQLLIIFFMKKKKNKKLNKDELESY